MIIGIPTLSLIDFNVGIALLSWFIIIWRYNNRPSAPAFSACFESSIASEVELSQYQL